MLERCQFTEMYEWAVIKKAQSLIIEHFVKLKKKKAKSRVGTEKTWKGSWEQEGGPAAQLQGEGAAG